MSADQQDKPTESSVVDRERKYREALDRIWRVDVLPGDIVEHMREIARAALSIGEGGK